MKLLSPAGVTSYQVTAGLRVRGSHEMPVSPPLHLRSVQRCRAACMGRAAPSAGVPGPAPAPRRSSCLLPALASEARGQNYRPATLNTAGCTQPGSFSPSAAFWQQL